LSEYFSRRYATMFDPSQIPALKGRAKFKLLLRGEHFLWGWAFAAKSHEETDRNHGAAFSCRRRED